ncbi:MAG: DUF3604 domain-containing protein, partial [Planctomycetes bacterium]|nr:DUF3604 domain-containing protein [Planctomycetota bacterium]
YLFARDRAFLDICAVTEHFAGSEGFPIPVVDKPLGDSAQFWPLAQRAVYDFYEPGTFVTLLGYEYTPRSGRGKVGDHCVYFLDPGHALVCDPSFGALVKRCAETDALIIPHVGGGWTDWQFEHFDEKAIRLVEVASMHEHSEWFAQDGLSRGFKLGIVGMSDGHIGCPGLDVWSRHGRTPNFKKRHFSVQSAITAVLAPDLTREAVWDALENRRVYATTGQRILLDFQMDGLGMGESYQTASPPKVKVEVNGMAKIDRVDLIRNQSLIHTHFGEDEDESFTFEDKFAPAGESYYYVRVTQSDSSFAWSSPIWVTFTGAPQKSETPEKAWNADPWPPAQTAQDVNYLSRVTAHIAPQTDAARLDLEQIGVFEEQR